SLKDKTLKIKEQVKNLGVLIDSDLSFNSHVKTITESAFYHFKNTAKRDLMTKQDLEKLVYAFISSKIDYCNGLMTGLPKKTIRYLLLIQNSAVRVLTKRTVLKFLHWLPVSHRLDFKVLLLIYKSLEE
ncbi:hypothetical protein LDENG_00156570, partial [Lucifuga dentata]